MPGKILVTGANGQLGTELRHLLPNAVFTDVAELDITNSHAVKQFLHNNNIDTVVNCAAYTAVDNAEDNFDIAYSINAIGPKNLAEHIPNIIHISTDYVFDGKKSTPYKTDDKPNPVSVYGKTKYAGENAVLETADKAVIIRTAWLYSPYGNNFVKTMRRLGQERESINVVCDQIGTPTYAADLAHAIVEIIPQISFENSGVYHFTNEGICSWYDFAKEIMHKSGLKCDVKPIPSSAYPTKASRPAYSLLDKSAIKNVFGIKIAHWADGLQRCISEINKQRV